MTRSLGWLPLWSVACGPAAPVADGEWPADDVAEPPPGCDTVTDVEGAAVDAGVPVNGTRAACTAAVHAAAGAAGSVLTVTLDAWGDGAARLTAVDVSGRALAAATVGEGDTLEVPLVATGEVLLRLAADDAAIANDYTLSVACTSGCDRGFTRHPVLLMHGLGGAGSFDGVDYYYGVRDALEADGYVVRNPSVEPFADSARRAEQWAAVVDGLLADGLGRKVNLVAHSQGGLDARYLAAELGYGDRVASIVTIGTPHHGTPVADVLSGAVEAGWADASLVDAGAAAFVELYGLDGDDASLTESLAALTTATLASFNAGVPDVPGVYYASWSGVTCGALDGDCRDAHGDEVVDPMLASLHLILWLDDLDSDGLVPVESAKWGDWRGTIDADHADEIGQFEDTDNPAFDHLAFYRAEVARLAEMGL